MVYDFLTCLVFSLMFGILILLIILVINEGNDKGGGRRI